MKQCRNTCILRGLSIAQGIVMKLRDLLFTASAVCLFSGLTHATPIIFDAGTSYTTSEVIDSSSGANLNGVAVTACFVSNECQTVLFDGSLGNAAFGAAIGDGWQLSLQGDSYINPFSFDTSVAVTQLHLNGAPGNIVFDTKDMFAGSTGTPGSQSGAFFEVDLFSGSTDFEPLSVVYSNQVWFGQTFYGDLYTSMTINFDPNGVVGSMMFYTDTDIASTVAVPASATLLLLLTGLLGLQWRRRH
ncbi:PEP-CTERM sorting domain-containing protein [Alkalimonas collagenimarina]|uniref:PEP-CTERM sorting domain-containing protein n=1 Tax=Alkalimonas collagenimarina TaxID=400390 RepID=A0ABT9GUY3_9GAMM|nr:PEP-CTERM sorting domain-containing protein [Alkalimonas collagenimarina]MDP4534861.1 PEP-CTERM sorting domain-containing protein [Alkalimonas collagenimarina]